MAVQQPNATYVLVDPNPQYMYVQQQQQPVMIQQQPMYMQQPLMMQQQQQLQNPMQQPAQSGYLQQSQQPNQLKNSYAQGQPVLQAQSYPINNQNINNQDYYHQGNGFNYQQGQGRVVNISSDFQRDLPTSANGAHGPTRIRCPFCKSEVTTQMETASGSGTWVACCLLFCITGWCCCLPFFIDDCQDKIFKCPKCKQVVGVKEYNII